MLGSTWHILQSSVLLGLLRDDIIFNNGRQQIVYNKQKVKVKKVKVKKEGKVKTWYSKSAWYDFACWDTASFLVEGRKWNTKKVKVIKNESENLMLQISPGVTWVAEIWHHPQRWKAADLLQITLLLTSHFQYFHCCCCYCCYCCYYCDKTVSQAAAEDQLLMHRTVLWFLLLQQFLLLFWTAVTAAAAAARGVCCYCFCCFKRGLLGKQNGVQH